MTTTDKLLPCPFCGGVLEHNGHTLYLHHNGKFILSGHKFLKAYIRQWNRRASQAAPAEAHVCELNRAMNGECMECGSIDEGMAEQQRQADLRHAQAAPAPSDGLRERAEAAERAHLSLCEAIGIPATALSHIEYTAQLTAARRAEAAAWNDAIEAADKAAIDRQGRRAMGDGHGNSCYDIGVSDAAAAIRALRRAAPTEGEA